MAGRQSWSEGPPVGPFLTRSPVKRQVVRIISNEGATDEHVREAWAHIQESSGYFDTSTVVVAGDIIEITDAHGTTERRVAARVDVNNVGGRHLSHIKVKWGDEAPPPSSTARELALSDLHVRVRDASLHAYVQGHLEQAVHEAFRSVEARDESPGASDTPALTSILDAARAASRLVNESKANAGEYVRSRDPHDALELLAFASFLHRRLDEATGGPDTE